jgi:predicted ATPase
LSSSSVLRSDVLLTELRSDSRLISSEFQLRRLSTRPRLRDHKNIQQLTINKLHYDSIDLVGREREIFILESCLARMTADPEDRMKELVMIKGYSGVGKSFLANTLEKSVSGLDNTIFVRGQFDLNNRDQPYSGISAAFGEIFRSVSTSAEKEEKKESNDELNTIGQTLVSELGSEVVLLQEIIPELDDILPTAKRGSNGSSESFNFDAAQERRKYGFRVLARVLSSYFTPMVLVLDDLQWADVSSLKVINHLLTDTLNPNGLMIVGCYRSNEVDDVHALSSVLSGLAEQKKRCKLNLTEIELGNIRRSDVNSIINAMLSIDDDQRTRKLAEISFKRTLGNAFFLIEFITMLEQDELITFNLGMLKWVWDEEEIENMTMATANVVDLLRARMARLSEKSRLLLQYAACLGASFNIPTLQLVWNKHSSTVSTPSEDSLSDLLKVVEDGNFVETSGTSTYRWVHDKVQEAELSLGGASEASFQFEIGTILYEGLTPEALVDELFDVTDLVNEGSLERRVEFAELNLRAAKKARSISAFSCAAMYVARGIEPLSSDKWTDHRDIVLRLYTIGAEMELALGHVDRMES